MARQKHDHALDEGALGFHGKSMQRMQNIFTGCDFGAEQVQIRSTISSLRKLRSFR